MAQAFRDFSSTSVGAQPATTTLRRNSTSGDYTRDDDDSTAVLEYLDSSGSTAARGLSIDDLVSDGQTQIHALIRDPDSSSPPNPRLLLFATDGPDNEYGAILNVGSNEVVAYKRIDGSFTSLASSATSLTASGYWNLRFEATPGAPNQLKVRVWSEGSSEPGTWDIETTDSDLNISDGGAQDGGWAGVLSFTSGDQVFYKNVGIGTNGDAAPTSDTGGTTYSPYWGVKPNTVVGAR